MKHLMVDIETLGTKSNSVIISLGAIFFDMSSGELGESFHQGISIKSCLGAGLEIDARTAIWWLNQEEALEQWAKVPKHDLTMVLDTFKYFIESESIQDNFMIWGNSNRFDLGLLENAYNKLGMEIPWNFRNERDVRTLVGFAPDIKDEVLADEKADMILRHDALNDCKTQIKYCSRIYSMLLDGVKSENPVT